MTTLKLGMIQLELDDETARLSDVRPFQPMLKLVEKTSLKTVDRAETQIQSQISGLIGKREYGDCDLIFVISCHCDLVFLISVHHPSGCSGIHVASQKCWPCAGSRVDRMS